MYRKAADTGIIAWDCRNEEEVVLCPYGLFWAGDNPMQAEECSQAGLACNYFCRTCKVGGTKQYKASDEGFQNIFKVRATHLCIASPAYEFPYRLVSLGHLKKP